MTAELLDPIQAQENPSLRVRIDLAYDGTNFHGWAKQPGLRSVQEEIESALTVLLRTQTQPQLTVGGRTDAGVHARGQVAHLDVTAEQLAAWGGRGAVDATEEQAVWLRARKLNGVLRRNAPDIAIHSVRVVPAAFDARFSALARKYEYRLRGEGAVRDPLTARFTTEIQRRIDFEQLQQAANELVGLRDFTTFCKAREGATAVRELQVFEWRQDADGVCVAKLQADAFCHSMVRALVGACVAVATGRLTLEQLCEARDLRARANTFSVLPPQGLILQEIMYPADAELAARAEQTRARRAPLDS